MAKKKNSNKPSTINNIESINMEIDYDKLAEAIVKAQKKSESKEKNHSKYRSGAMNFFNGAIYSTVYVMAVMGIVAVWKESFANQDTSLISCIVITVAFIIVGVYAFLCQQESFNDKESETFEHFNANISLIALLVAIVALFKGVG